MRTALLALVASLALSGPVAAQVYLPGQPYIGDPMADQLRNRTEIQRLQSEQRAAAFNQYQTEARLTAQEVINQRQAAPYVPLVDVPQTPDARRRAQEAATQRRQTVVEGVSQIDRWLDRAPN